MHHRFVGELICRVYHHHPPCAGAVANEARAEIEFMRGLEHPHIVRLYGAEQEGEEVHIVMEYANGGDVAQLIKKRMGRTIPEQVLGGALFSPFLSLCLGIL